MTMPERRQDEQQLLREGEEKKNRVNFYGFAIVIRIVA